MCNVISTNQLIIKYGNKLALDQLTISLHENQLIGLIGRNGAGKTTFMKSCTGLIEPSGGTISVLGRNPINCIDVLTEVVYSYSNVPYKESNSLQTILDYYTMFYPKFDSNFAHKLLDIFSLTPFMKYKSLSQGMSSIFNFICALSTRAKITLFDEPVIGMDITARKKIYEILLRDYMEYPRTILVSSHLLAELENILSEILLLDNGKVIFYKDIEEVGVMAYRIDGSEKDVNEFTLNRNVLYMKHNSTGSYAIIESKLDESDIEEGKNYNITLSKVRPEDTCIYKTIHGGETDIECLWEK